MATGIGAITGELAKVKTLVDEVKLAGQEQARGVEQMSEAVTRMQTVTQATAANAEEGATAAEEFEGRSATLKDIVGRLTAMAGEATRR